MRVVTCIWNTGAERLAIATGRSLLPAQRAQPNLDSSMHPLTPYGLAPPHYRLPPATRLGAVRLQVADLARSLDYYQRVLGFQLLNRTASAAQLGVTGPDAMLVELREVMGATPVPRRGRLGLFHFAILLPDRASLGRFVGHLDALSIRTGASDHLVSEAIYVHDPDGLGIEVYADRPRASWRRVEGQLAMASDPLDLAALVRAAGSKAWTGMPPGTSIGHVHLHVGDLDQAAAFYHDGLGLDKTVWNYPGALFLAADGYHHHLGVNTWASGAAPAGERDARLLEWQVVVPTIADAHAAVASIEGGGYSAVRTSDGGTATDPWGTAVRVLPITTGIV